jgi:hypothetical protein
MRRKTLVEKNLGIIIKMSDGKLEEARTNNVLSSKPSSSGKQDEYYAFKLRQEKVANAKDKGKITSEEEKALTSISELDQLELKALARLYTLSDNSPELLQYFQITHCSTREAVAQKLAKKQLRKQLTEEAIKKILDPDAVATMVDRTLTTTRQNRARSGFGITGGLTF